MSVAEAAEALGLGKTLTRELIANGELRSVRVKRRVIVTVNEIHSYLAPNIHENS